MAWLCYESEQESGTAPSFLALKGEEGRRRGRGRRCPVWTVGASSFLCSDDPRAPYEYL